MMRARTIAIVWMLCVVGAIACFAQDAAFFGTWKLKEAKSEFSSGAAKNTTVVYEAVGEKVKVTVDSVSSDGKPTHYTWIGKFDGKDYPVTGDPMSDARSYTRVDNRILGFNISRDGKLVTSGRIELSADGKTRTVTMSGGDGKGHTVSSAEVYEKQ
jgi:hypothetical protein